MNKDTYTPFLDLFLNIALCFIAITCILFIKFKTEEEKENKKIDSKAEFIITATWPEEYDADVDVYLEDPLGNVCYYRKREIPLASLDRDDRGNTIADSTVLADGSTYFYENNQEIITIRRSLPGEYIFNVHGFNMKSCVNTEVLVEIMKLNPNVKTVASKTVIIPMTGNEITVFRFTIDDEGNISDINDLPKQFVYSTNQDSLYGE